MKEYTLERVCDIANNWVISPQKVVKLYNRAINKHYINKDPHKAMDLVERYVEIHKKPKIYYRDNWGYNRIVDFEKKKVLGSD